MLDAIKIDVVKIIKSLYEIFEANNHWFATYYKHHIEKLKMNEFIYNFCFFYNNQLFDLMNLQINDTLILINDEFAIRENEIIQNVKIMSYDEITRTTYYRQLSQVQWHQNQLVERRLQWQIDHKSRRLRYVQLNEKSLRIMIFINFFLSIIEISSLKSII